MTLPFITLHFQQRFWKSLRSHWLRHNYCAVISIIPKKPNYWCLTLFDPYTLTVFWQCSLLCIFSEFESPPPRSQSPCNTIIVLLSFQRDLIYITMSEELHHAMPQKCVIGCAIFSTGLCSIVFLLQFLNHGEFTRSRYKIVSDQMQKNILKST